MPGRRCLRDQPPIKTLGTEFLMVSMVTNPSQVLSQLVPGGFGGGPVWLPWERTLEAGDWPPPHALSPSAAFGSAPFSVTNQSQEGDNTPSPVSPPSEPASLEVVLGTPAHMANSW